jgi:hypothetical protein
MNNTGTPEKVNLPDTEVEWYDFGGGFPIAPTTDVEGTRLPGLQSDAPNMVALCCVRNGLYYYKMIEGTFTNEDLPRMFKEYAPAFKEEVEARSQR